MTKKLLPFLFMALSLSAAQAQWVQKASVTGAAGRFWAASFSAAGKGYAGLGRTGFSGNAVSDFWCYDPASDTWTQIADFPGGVREGAAGFSAGDKGFVGFGTAFINFSKDLYEYSPAANAWTQKASHPGIGFAYSQGFVIDSLLYIGPENGTNKFYAYNINRDTWSEKAAFPGLDRRAHVAFATGGKGYIGLGFWVFGSVQRDFYQYDPATDTWVQISDMNLASDQSTGFGLNGKGYVYNVGQNGKDTYRYDPASDSWELEVGFPGNRTANATTFAIGSKGYLVFGEETVSGGNNPSNKLWEFTPSIPFSVGDELEAGYALEASSTAEGIYLRARYAGAASVALYDLQGRLLARRELPPGQHWEGLWQPESACAGVCLVGIEHAGRRGRLQKVLLR